MGVRGGTSRSRAAVSSGGRERAVVVVAVVAAGLVDRRSARASAHCPELAPPKPVMASRGGTSRSRAEARSPEAGVDTAPQR